MAAKVRHCLEQTKFDEIEPLIRQFRVKGQEDAIREFVGQKYKLKS
jgi:hypothetical protein